MIWREIPGFTSYEVSECGDIRRKLNDFKKWPPRRGPRTERGKIITPCGFGIKDKYLDLRLVSDTKGSVVAKVHIMTALAFCGPKPTEAHCACHLDDDKYNNYYKNLYWGTKKENAIDRSINGKHGIAKLTPNDVGWIWELYHRDKWFYREIAELYNVSMGTIAQIIKGKTFTWVRKSIPWFPAC